MEHRYSNLVALENSTSSPATPPPRPRTLLQAFMLSQDQFYFMLGFLGVNEGKRRCTIQTLPVTFRLFPSKRRRKWATSRAVLGNVMETVVLYPRRNAHRWEC